ncbi:hypothetical protein POTOM_038248 [Populus tomentosa]|uniref:Uncharacterized protein n=1 Tax=Populus tomentosa TaxID=118781 RepID=A0A8X7YVA4_POPTO|nr:hypothetical protein POTOM_038248 [Populus tomentosa]
MDAALGRALSPPFDPYASSLHYRIASHVIPYVGLAGYVGANPNLQAKTSKRLVAGLSAVEGGQDAAGIKDEGLVVPKRLGAEGRIGGKVLSGDEFSLGYARTPEEIPRAVFGSGN